MARIAGVDLPRDKRIEYALTYIFGIGLPTSQNPTLVLRISRMTRLSNFVMPLITISLWRATFAAIFKWTSSDSLILAVIADAVTVSVFPFVDKTPKTTQGLARVPKNLFRAARKKTN